MSFGFVVFKFFLFFLTMPVCNILQTNIHYKYTLHYRWADKPKKQDVCWRDTAAGSQGRLVGAHGLKIQCSARETHTHREASEKK